VTQYNDLLTRLRTAMPTKVITIAVGNWSNLPAVAGASYSQLDQINLMCYDMDSPGNGYSWYNDALLQSGNLAVMTCDWRARAFTSAGVAASKIGVPDYRNLVVQKLDTAEDLHRFLIDQFHQGRAFVLEVMVVIILIIELVYAFRGKG